MTRPCILIVEDNLMSLTLTRDVLQMRGHATREATSVDTARASLSEGAPALVLMDVMMPGGGGLLLLEEMKRSPALSRVPVIAVTAHAMQGDREKLLAAGFDGYLSKPLRLSSFCSTVEGFLAQA